MALGDFTVEEAATVLIAVDEMFQAIPKSKQGNYLGHLNEICLFIEAAQPYLENAAMPAELSPAPQNAEPSGPGA